MVERLKQQKWFIYIRRFIAAAAPAGMQAAVFLFTAFCAPAPFVGGIMPIGVAAAMGASNAYALAAGAGAVVGYAAALQFGTAAKYLAAVCVMSLVRWLTQSLKSTKFIAAVAGICTLTLIQFTFVGSIMKQYSLGLVLGEAMLCAGMGYMFAVMPKGAAELKKGIAAPKKAALITAAICLFAACGRISFFEVSFLQIIAAAAILAACYTNGERGAAVCGGVYLLSLALTASGSIYGGAALLLAGITAGIFCRKKRLLSAGVFLTISLFGAGTASGVTAALTYCTACLLGTVVFLLLPDKLLNAVPYIAHGTIAADNADVSKKLGELSAALGDVGRCVNDIYRVLPQEKNAASPVEYACNSVCAKCKMNTKCWIENFDDTNDQLNKAVAALRENGYITTDNLSPRLVQSCKNAAQLCGAISKGFAIELAKKTASVQSKMLRSALNEQYGAMAGAIDKLSRQINTEQKCDTVKTAAVNRLFCEIDLEPVYVAAEYDLNGRMRVQVKTARAEATERQLRQITAEVGRCCGRSFSCCAPSNGGAYTTFLFLEKPFCVPQFAKAVRAADNKVSADIIDYFCDENTNAHLLLCDGMGTGTAAAIDGKMAAALTRRLLSAGFGCEAAARLVNVAMYLKGGEPGGAAVDAFTVNLFTGEAALFKAGAATSFLVCGDTVTAVSADSLPIGGMSEVNAKISRYRLNAGDKCILVSDGALCCGEENIKRLIEKASDFSPQRLADTIADFAQSRSVRKDDISVAVLYLQDE